MSDFKDVIEQNNLEATNRRNKQVQRAHIFDTSLVVAELDAATEKLANLGVAVSIFGSARLPETSPAYQSAFNIAKALSEKGVSIITGGGPGAMVAANKGCREGKFGISVGLNIKLPREQSPNLYQDISLSFEHFLTRKTIFMAYSEAFVCVPGGFGTLDELIEVLTLMQTQKMPVKPIVLVNREFWAPLMNWFKSEFLKHEMIVESDLNKFTIVDTVDEVLAALSPCCGYLGAK